MSPSTHDEAVLSSGAGGNSRPPRGYVPVLVGDDDEEEVERFFVHVNLINEPYIIQLLEMAAEEFGYSQQGVLRIPCTVQHFRNTVDEIIYNSDD
ncbi:hypothetical protein KSP39_PZI009140 [Platanthera zijinensis]|uniref:Small auxin up regulated protein n=1 Tax=Platanthera zijinensis TaxID=2320716 RepID=A0AAP0BJX2_9ASPA